VIKLINDNALFGVAVSVNEPEFDSYGISHIGSAYSYCCWQVLAAIQSWIADNDFSGDVAYFFEAGNKYESEANTLMRRISPSGSPSLSPVPVPTKSSPKRTKTWVWHCRSWVARPLA
jgi:hypothetical protein